MSVQHVGAGPGQSTEGTDTILLDERLFAGSGLDFDDHVFIRIQGSSRAPLLSHGQIVFAEPCSEVVGQDLYVYWKGDERGNVVAIIERTSGGLRIEKRGPTREVTYWTQESDNVSVSDSGKRATIQIKARVLGAFSRPADELGARTAAAVNAATALQS